MMSQKIVAGILAAAITVSSIAPEAFAEISGVGVGGTSTVNESTVDTSTDPASVGSDKTEESGKTVLSSEPGEGESDYTYNALEDGTIEITGYSGSAENIVIPAQIDGKSVTRIGNNAFEKSSAKEIVIPDSVTEIGSQAFSGCGKLTGVSIPNSVTTIRDRAFFDCNSLASITIPDSVTDIELQAFCNCTSLKSVTIPASVTDIGDEAFGYYFNDIDESEIKKVDGFKINYVKNTYGHYYATKNGFSDEDCLLTNELNDGTLEISNYAGNSATYEIPGEIDGKKVIRIGDYAFSDCTELTSVTIPDSVTDIRWRAFYNCVSLKSVTIPKSVTYIDNYAFGYYDDSDSFETKKIDGFKINYVKNTHGHMYALKNGFTDEACLLTHELYDGTLEITEYVGNSATYVIPSEIDGKRVTQIGYDAFNDCTELTSITIPDGVTIIGNSAFSDCTSLETVTIPNSVTHIYTRAFYNCTSLKEVTIPASVTDIGDEAFGYYYDRDSWKEKKVDGFKINYVNNTRGHWYAIKNGFTDGDCFVVNELDDGTAEITGYAGNSATCVIPDEIHGKKVTRIGDSAFKDSTKLTSVTIPDSVKYIVDRAFFGCTSLETVTIPNSVINICSSAFYNCTSLKEVTIPASVTDIGDEAFGYYSDIDGSEIKKVDGFKINYVKNTYGHYYATKNGFSDEDCLLTNELNDGTLEISNYAGNSATYEIPGEIDGKKVIRIGDYAFSDCTELTSVTIPDSVTDIRWRAFYNCVSLKSVTIPKSVTYIDNYAFGYYDDSDSFETKKIDGFKINYVKNTHGHMYALKNGFTDEACLLTHELYDGTLEITEYVGNSATYVIPSEIDGKRVTQIGYDAFNDCTELTSITIPDGVTIIGNSAFSDCTSLETVTIPNSVTQIYPRAFYNCTSLKEVAIPASVTVIRDEAFGYYYDIDSSETKKADGFKINYVNNTQGHWYAIKNGFTDGACFVVNELGDGTVGITGYAGNSATCVIPDEIHGKKVTRIGENAFRDRTELTSVTIPDSVTDIEQYAFEGCTSLSDITLPDSLTSIGLSAFESCTALTDIALPDSLTYIDGFAFANCTSLKTVTVPASVTFIGGWAFGYYFEDGNIDARVAFDDFTINYTKHTAGHLYAIENGFTDEGCLEYTVNADGTLEIDKYVGNDTIFEIPAEIGGKKVTSIGYKAFENRTSLTSVTIPDSLTDIGFQAFHNCTSLKSVTIPASVTTIDNYAFGYFYDANKETKIDGFKINYTKNTAGHLYAAQNGFTDEACLINELQDDGTVIITKYAGNDTVYEIPSEIDGKKVTGIGNRAFQNSTSLTNVTIPDGVTHIDECAFQGCSSLTDIALPDSLTIIDSYAFNNCAMLTSITIPNGVTRIEWATFYGCSSLTDLVLPDSVTYIGYKVFFDCPSLKTVTIPASVTDIGEYAFGYHDDDNWNLAKIDGFKINYTKNTWGHYYAKQNGFSDEPCLVAELNEDGTTLKISKYDGNDTEYVIPEEIDGKKISEIRYNAFIDCKLLTSVTIPDGVTMIGSAAFRGCTALTDVVLPDSVTSIGDFAFYNCPKLLDVTIPDSVTNIGDYAFGFDENDEKIDGFKIYCYGGTAGEQYAKDNEFEYEILECKVHKFGDWKTTKPATCTATGTKTRTCSVCGKVETATIAKTAHKYVNTVVKPTYAAQGYTLHKCSVCGASYKDNETSKLTLAKVTGFKVKSLTSTNVTLQWNKNANASGYEIEQYKDGKWVNVAKITGNATTSYTVKGLKAGTAGYQFRIRAYRTEGKNKAYSGYSATVKVNTNPYGVSGFKCSSKASTSVTLKWNKGTTASGYQLQQYKNGKWVTIYTGTKATNTSYTVKKLKAGTAGYRFRIRAYKTYGNTKQYGSWSSEVKVNTNPYGVGGFKCSSKSSTSVTLKWNKGTTASGYQLQQYKSGKWVTIYTGTKATNTSYTVKGLKAGTAGYRFRIRAYKTYGNTKQYGSWSSEVKVNTNPYGVGGFKAKSTAKTSITLGWNKGTTASGYQLQQYKGGKWVTVYTGTKATSTRCTVKSLKSNTSYKFRIRAYKTYGNAKQYGSWSGTLTVRTKK